MSAPDAHEILVMFYETEFGIFDHSDPEISKRRPIASVAMHDTEAIGEGSQREELMTLFARNEVSKYFNISWSEFVAQTRSDVNMMMRVAEREKARENATKKAEQDRAQAALNAAQQASNNLGKGNQKR